MECLGDEARLHQ